MKQKNNGGKAVIKNLLISIFSFIFLLLFINTYFISATKISGESMFPSFTTGDHVMFSKISTYTPNSYKSGDVVVCRFGMQEYNEENNTFVQNNTSTYIKRIIALEGDTVEISEGKVYVNEKDVTNKYWGNVSVQENLLHLKVPKGHVFVIGDNINNSIDSRVVGSIPYSNILGKVVYKIQYKNLFSENSAIKIPTFLKIE
jgi:signal peptidase I